MGINFTNIKSIYNEYMDMMLASDGLSTPIIFTFGVTDKQMCVNCIYDVGLQKSANKYKSGGPVPFAVGKICPYCNGIGYYGEVTSETGYLGVIWDYRKWINPPLNLAQPDGMIQTICNKTYLPSIRKCKEITITYPSSVNQFPKFQLYGEPNPAGLGDNNYIISMWKKVN